MADRVCSLRTDIVHYTEVIVSSGIVWGSRVIKTYRDALEYCIFRAEQSGVAHGFEGLNKLQRYEAYRYHKYILGKSKK